MKTRQETLIGRTIEVFAEYRRQRRLRSAVKDFDRHMLADIGLERDLHGGLHPVR